MFDKLTQFFTKTRWRLVKTISVDFKYERSDGRVYYHLFESNKGGRKVEINCTLTLPSFIKIEEESRKFKLYQEKIYRWEKGRYDPDIPRYDQVPEEDTANALKGTIK